MPEESIHTWVEPHAISATEPACVTEELLTALAYRRAQAWHQSYVLTSVDLFTHRVESYVDAMREALTYAGVRVAPTEAVSRPCALPVAEEEDDDA